MSRSFYSTVTLGGAYANALQAAQGADRREMECEAAHAGEPAKRPERPTMLMRFASLFNHQIRASLPNASQNF